MTVAPVTFVHNEDPGRLAYVLDDDHKVATLITRMLHTAGFAAIAFNEPGQCLNQLKAAKNYSIPAVFILDLSLGKTDGIEVLNELKNLKYKGRVLLISGKDKSALLEIERMGSARGLLMLPSLQKPFQVDDLTKRLKIELDPVDASPKESTATRPKTGLEQAISNGRLIHRYQGRFDVNSQSVRGAELVLYERHPADGLIPLTTSSVPSSSPIFHPLSRLLLPSVLQDWSQYLSDIGTPIRLFIKLPLSVVTTSNFLSLLREKLAAYPRFPGLVIEVEDWHQFNDLGMIREVSAQLKLYNVGLAVSDIGAIYSAITESYKIPFEEFKLNASLISNCALNETKKALCANTINLAHDAGASVCAEGVANRDEFEALINMKCDTVQGSLFGKPQPIESFKSKFIAPPTQPAVNSDSELDMFAWPDSASA